MSHHAEELHGRKPTRHERQAGRPWDASYRDGPAPWDIGAAQPAVLRLATAGAFAGEVLDAGCGTGDNAACIAAQGVHVYGFDVAPTAVRMARERAAAQHLDAEFVVADALDLRRLDRRFDTVLDCALFHALDPDERRTYVAGIASVTNPGAALYLLAFATSDAEAVGPHPVSRQELCQPFNDDPHWNIRSIDTERLHARFAPQGVPAWRLRADRVAPP